MKKFVFTLLMFGTCLCAGAQTQQSITVKGKVKFIDPGFKMQVYQREGTSKKILAETTVNDDHTYSFKVPFDKPGEATLDCGQWQSVQVWLENENLDVDFRGLDTARVKIKNPPYVYIRGGKNNDLMNLINFESYRNYQAMIATSQAVYRADIGDEKTKQKLSMTLYDASGDNFRAHTAYFIEHFADRNSVLAAISRAGDDQKPLVDAALAQLETLSPVSRQLVADYRKAEAEKLAAQQRMAVGNPAPQFTFLNVKGKKESLDKYKGKVLVLDFWASWCGPCRAEIPNMKKLYEEYRGKGVEFLSVSIDAKKAAWDKARAEEKMAWPQGWTPDAGKSVMDTYQFGGIPFILVIDKDGNIYRKNVRGDETRTALDDVLSGKKAVQPRQGKAVMMGASM